MIQTTCDPAIGKATESDRCTAGILDRIRKREIRPGQRLGEVALARNLKTGRAAVRVALDRLGQIGILDRIPDTGTFVRKVSLEEYCELMDIRAVLEGLAGRLACDRMNAAAASELMRLATEADRANDALRNAAEQDWTTLRKTETAFHEAIIRASGNQRIIKILFEQHLFEHAFAAALSFPICHPPGRVSSRGCRLPNHRAIARVVRARKHDRAELLLKQHVLVTKEEQIALIKGAGPVVGGPRNS
ncbi:MAG: GntR family transcriptional regulator [Verrucomicrobia bacterium]|nr:GntR family transcriptional regulator [Verrucomicrobiota bacterium]